MRKNWKDRQGDTLCEVYYDSSTTLILSVHMQIFADIATAN